jgi:hypothetical protein
MNKERMLQSVEFLRSIPDEAFYYSSWFTHHDFEGDLEGQLIHDCGTQACAGGWMARAPIFQAQGLTISGAERYPAFHNLVGASALAAFLDIDIDAAKVIFLWVDDYYELSCEVKARHVAQALEDYLNGEFDEEKASEVIDMRG